MASHAHNSISGHHSSNSKRSRWLSVAITLCLAMVFGQLNSPPASATLPNMYTPVVPSAISAGQTTSQLTFNARTSGLVVPAQGYVDFSITPTTGVFTGTLPMLFGVSGGYAGSVTASDVSSGNVVKLRYTFSASWTPSFAQNTLNIPAGAIAFTGAGPAQFQVEVFDSAGTAQNNVVPLSVNYSQVVTFNANDGSGSTTTQVSSSASSLTSNTFSRNGYVFNGWKTSANGQSVDYVDGAQYPFTSSTTLYADWSPVFTLTFNSNDGSGSPSETTQTGLGTTWLNGNSFTRSGFTFDGWNTLAGGGGTSYTDGDVFTLSANTTLYAQWSVLSFVVTFEANDGSGGQTTQQGLGSTSLTPNTFTRSGYVFAGWDTLPGGGGTTYADSDLFTISSNETLYATWTPVFTLTFNANDGSGTPAETTQVGSGATTLNANAFSRNGYSFGGWNTLAGGGGTAFANGDSLSLSSNTTLYAVWVANSFTVTFDANDGSGTPAQTSQMGSGVTALNANTFIRNGYSFAGWNTISGGAGTAYADSFATYALNASTVLYAQWQAVTPVVVAPPAQTPNPTPEAPAAISAPSIETIGLRKFDFGTSKSFELTGVRFDDLISATAGSVALKIISNTPTTIKLDLGDLSIGIHDIVFKFKTGTLIFQEAVNVLDPAVAAAAAAKRLPKPVVKKPVVKKPVVKKPIVKKPIVKKPIVKKKK